MGEITLTEVVSRKDLKRFIYLPEKVHRNNTNWLPPLLMDEWLLFDPKKNKSFEYCDHIRLLALKDGKVAGRIMGLVNRRYNEIQNEQHGRFCFLECYNDREVSHALINRVEEWARQKGLDKVIGPMGFSDKDPQGAQISGFEYSPVIAAPNNADYLPGLIEAEGYTRKIDLVDYMADIPEELPDLYKRVLSRFGNRQGYKIIEFRTKKDIKPMILDVLQVMNDAYSSIFGFVPLTDKEKKELAARYLPILDPRFIKAFSINDRVVGFVIAMPDLAEGLRKSRGRLFPFGFIHILRASKKSNNLQMLLGAILEEYRGLGLDVIMGAKILEEATRSRMKTLDSHLILEDNMKSRSEFDRINGKVVKTYRIYQKDL